MFYFRISQNETGKNINSVKKYINNLYGIKENGYHFSYLLIDSHGNKIRGIMRNIDSLMFDVITPFIKNRDFFLWYEAVKPCFENKILKNKIKTLNKDNYHKVKSVKRITSTKLVFKLRYFRPIC